MFCSAPKFHPFFVDDSVSGRSPRLPTRLRDVADGLDSGAADRCETHPHPQRQLGPLSIEIVA